LPLDLMKTLFAPTHVQVVEPAEEALEGPHFLQPDYPIALL
jgi:hypothetical protein